MHTAVYSLLHMSKHLLLFRTLCQTDLNAHIYLHSGLALGTLVDATVHSVFGNSEKTGPVPVHRNFLTLNPERLRPQSQPIFSEPALALSSVHSLQFFQLQFSNFKSIICPVHLLPGLFKPTGPSHTVRSLSRRARLSRLAHSCPNGAALEK